MLQINHQNIYISIYKFIIKYKQLDTLYYSPSYVTNTQNSFPDKSVKVGGANLEFIGGRGFAVQRFRQGHFTGVGVNCESSRTYTGVNREPYASKGSEIGVGGFNFSNLAGFRKRQRQFIGGLRWLEGVQRVKGCKDIEEVKPDWFRDEIISTTIPPS